VYLPGVPFSNAFAQLLSSADPAAFGRNYRYDVSPVSDDRPFFFYTVQPRDLLDFMRNANAKNEDYKINSALPVLFALIAVSIGATGVVSLLPRMILRSRLPKQSGVILFLGYFFCLGAGYILIQVALIQKFVLLLGHPSYALTVIIFSMLVASGVGSYWSRRIIGADDARLIRALAVIAVLVAVLAFGASSLVSAAAAWPLGLKMAVTALAIAPVAFIMGMPFPSGLRRLESFHSASVRWAWSLNAAASVLGSAGAIVMALYAGLRTTLLVGGALYVCALLLITAVKRTERGGLTGPP
jgi:hypothetical protein